MNAVKLIMMTDQNNNKFYNMIPNNDGTFTATYGRIDSTSTNKIYPMSKWDATYRNKVKKGYKDVTELYIEVKASAVKASSPFDKLISRLERYAKKMADDNYTISSSSVTQAMVDEAQSIINRLVVISKNKDANAVSTFNTQLIKLFNVLPRKMKKVNMYLANASAEFKQIISREQDMLDALASTMTVKTDKAFDNILDKYNLKMQEKDDALEQQVKDMLGEISDKYKNCWYIENVDTQERYDKHVAAQRGIHKTEQVFWHGSRNENWLSILKNGMMIRPANVIHTGAMFGEGIYFANKARKSYGYTSATGSYWANGTSKTAFMALFKVNTGKHHNVYHHTSECYNFNKDNLKKKGNFDSVYAHKGADLRNDEFMVYDISQVTIYALVELKA